MSAGSDKDLGSGALTPRDAAVADAQPTPGPWVVDSSGFHIWAAARPEVRSVIASVGVSHSECRANARLIAAAPDALAACQALIKGDDLQFAIDLARAAIAKARG